LCLDKTTTGDGLISALQVLAIMKQTGSGLAELAAGMKKYPQVLLNVRVAKRFDPLTEPDVTRVVEEVEHRLQGRGRIVLRASGTEAVIRVMVEGSDAALVKKGAKDIAAAVEAASGVIPSRGLQLAGGAANLRRLSRRANARRLAMRRPMVAGNWKMHGSQAANRALLAELEGYVKPDWPIDIVVFPPYVYLADAVRVLEEGRILVGAQDVCAESGGAFTGQVGAAMLKDVGCSYVIVGHSERRRWYHEDDALVARKFAAALAGRLTPVLCVGETWKSARRSKPRPWWDGRSMR